MKDDTQSGASTFARHTTVLVLMLVGSLLYFYCALYVVSVWFAGSRLAAWVDPFAHQHSRDYLWRAAQQFAGLILTSLPFAGMILWTNRRRWLVVSSALPFIGLTLVIVPSSYETWVQMPARHLFFSVIFIVEYLITLPLVTGALLCLTTSRHDD